MLDGFTLAREYVPFAERTIDTWHNFIQVMLTRCG
jgi:hypothetical protein